MEAGKKPGLAATLIVLMVLAGALAIIGAVVWLRMAPKGVPTQPGEPTRPTSTLQVPSAPSVVTPCRIGITPLLFQPGNHL